MPWELRPWEAIGAETELAGSHRAGGLHGLSLKISKHDRTIAQINIPSAEPAPRGKYCTPFHSADESRQVGRECTLSGSITCSTIVVRFMWAWRVFFPL